MDEWRRLEEAAHEEQNNEDRDLINKAYNSLTSAQKEAYENGDYRQFFTETELVLSNGQLVHVSNKDELKKRADNCNNETGIVAWVLR